MVIIVVYRRIRDICGKLPHGQVDNTDTNAMLQHAAWLLLHLRTEPPRHRYSHTLSIGPGRRRVLATRTLRYGLWENCQNSNPFQRT